MEARTIAVCPGIGDVVFMLVKLISLGEKFHWQIPASKPNRGHQVFELLPQVTASWKYDESINIRQVLLGNAQETYGNAWEKIKHSDHFFLSANKWLDEGYRIEGWLPDLPISFKLPWVISKDAENKAWEYYKLAYEASPDKGEVKLFGIYPSAYANNTSWGGWNSDTWLRLIEFIHKENPNIVFVIIGAVWDTDLSDLLMAELEIQGIPYVNTIGQPLDVVVSILKLLDYFIGFPSGLSILNETLAENKRTFMFYPPHLEPMIPAWAEPNRIKSGDYKGMLFCNPRFAFNWMKNEYKLFEKI